MSPEALRQKIEKEIGGNWDLTNLHKIDLKKCLLGRPIQKIYENSLYQPDLPEDTPDNTRLLLLWQVLEENPAGEGYAIVYNEKSKLFGLAQGKTLIGFYGSFRAALGAM
jgi:hypothetical protein